jgi:hypothetical protein
MLVGRAPCIAFPVDYIIDRVNAAREQTEDDEAQCGRVDIFDAAETAGKQQRREDKEIFDPVFRPQENQHVPGDF